ncbi:MAG TPA: DNA alkylation repair protein [Salinivirga sp.]|uniref:DNA alkylation repair protein n=1 Tax=Salinivirga sp. TaxID=1970192 RepID=UPI002B473833|nr:DNA alkylation repair protein [Salinivirga sp.]HKK59565.1 DNA alkylation repair protein [Salinivirga sp.]
MNTQKLVNQIIYELKSLQDDTRKASAMGNFPGKLEIIGVSSPNIKKVVIKVRKTTNSWTLQQKTALAINLTQTHYHECHHLAYYFLEQEPKVINILTIEEAEKLAACLDNWVLTDTYSTFILGVLWRIGTVDDQYIHNLLKSDDLWLKRCAVVSTVPLNQASRGGKGDSKRTIEVCRKVVNDHRPMIIKALSWALRVLIRRDKKAVENFIQTNAAYLHKQVIREVSNKLETGLKNP